MYIEGDIKLNKAHIKRQKREAVLTWLLYWVALLFTLILGSDTLLSSSTQDRSLATLQASLYF